MADLSEIVRTEFPRPKLLIVGDLVADQFLNGTISRVSREAPVFILNHDSTDTRAGGAGNAAVNVASLGAVPRLAGFAGRDANGDTLLAKLEESNVDTSAVVRSDAIQTTTKVRVLAGQHYAARQQVIRIDYENRAAIGDDDRSVLIRNIEAAAADADAIVLSDYNYGVVDAVVYSAVKRLAAARSIPLLVDSRFHLGDLEGATTATPNSDEVEHILGIGFTNEQCSALRVNLGLVALLITRGNKGMQLFEAGKPPCDIGVIGATEPVDVTGAGDTVIAVYALGLASGLGFYDAACIANHAGGIVVMKKGTAFVTPDELISSLLAHSASELSSNA
jgi:rfaE bifunctional protein kinase chain/domain